MNLLKNLFPFLFDKHEALPPPKDPEPGRFDYHRDLPQYGEGKHVQQFTNSTSSPMEVYVEMNPDRYVLQPKDEMTIIYEQDSTWPGLGLSTNVYEDGLQIFLQEFDTAIVLINGKYVEPWADQADVVKDKT